MDDVRSVLSSRAGASPFDQLAQDFMTAILGHPEAVLSDWEDLADFYHRPTGQPPTVDEFDRWHEERWAAIEKRYKVNVRGVYHLNDIFRAIRVEREHAA